MHEEKAIPSAHNKLTPNSLMTKETHKSSMKPKKSPEIICSGSSVVGSGSLHITFKRLRRPHRKLGQRQTTRWWRNNRKKTPRQFLQFLYSNHPLRRPRRRDSSRRNPPINHRRRVFLFSCGFGFLKRVRSGLWMKRAVGP